MKEHVVYVKSITAFDYLIVLFYRTRFIHDWW